jgi:hypothetical protein
LSSFYAFENFTAFGVINIIKFGTVVLFDDYISSTTFQAEYSCVIPAFEWFCPRKALLAIAQRSAWSLAEQDFLVAEQGLFRRLLMNHKSNPNQ